MEYAGALTVNDSPATEVEPDRITFGVCVGIATCCVAALLVTRPDIAPLLDRARPYISDWWSTSLLLPGNRGHS